MITRNLYRGILYTGGGIVILIAVLLILIVLPSVILDKSPQADPVSAVFGTLLTVILHLLVLYAFREAIIVNKRNGYLEKIVFIASGAGLLLLGLLIADGAFAFKRHVQMHLT
jgi:branched-subunit amino acid transport protein AzlD